MAGARILIVEDDDLLRQVTSERLEREGYAVVTAASVAAARAELERHTPDVALLDVKLPDGLGTELLPELMRTGDTVCVMMSAHGTVQSAVDALRSGAVDYMEKPFSFDRLDATMRNALERTRLRREVRALRKQAGPDGPVIGDSPAMRAVAAANGPVCFAAIRELMRTRHADVKWPVEYRTLRSDDALDDLV